MDDSLPGPSVHGTFQARTLEWVSVSYSTCVSLASVPSTVPGVRAWAHNYITRVWWVVPPVFHQHSVDFRSLQKCAFINHRKTDPLSVEVLDEHLYLTWLLDFDTIIFRFSHLHWETMNKIRLTEGQRRLNQLRKNPGKLGLRSTKTQMSELMKLHPSPKSSTLAVKL